MTRPPRRAAATGPTPRPALPPPASPPRAPTLRDTSRPLALLLALTACDEPLAPFPAVPDDTTLSPAADAPRSPCPGSDAAFVFRALRLIEGRRPAGVRELNVLTALISELDAAGLPGRRLIAESLFSFFKNSRAGERWQTFLLDHLHIPRLGATSSAGCYGQPGPLAAGPELAAFIRDHGPEEPIPEDMSDWTVADLLASAVALDDLSPILRAQLVARQARPVGGNNVTPVELERARRVALGRGFEAAWLGRRLECLPCHNSDASVTDHPEPALDRSWPVLPGLEASVYGNISAATEASAYAGQRVHGFVDGPLAPWGSRRCGDFDPARADLLATPGFLAGPLPAGAHVLDLEGRLRRGLEILRRDGLDAASTGPEPALAGLVALNLADAVWRAASGHPLTLPHGQPRNALQRRVLRELGDAFVDSGFSLRALVIAAALHPYLDLDEPSACAGAQPPILDPFAEHNHAGDALRPEDPWVLLDTAAHALGWRTPKRFPLPFGWEDETLLRSLGVYLDDSEPGHRSLDLVAALAWERSVGAGRDPGWAGAPPQDHDPDADILTRLTALARADPTLTVEDAALAVQDRIIQEPAFTDAAHRAETEALLALPLHSRAADHDAQTLESALRRLAGALLMSPQFTLAGLPPPPATTAPRLVLPEATTRALCERHAARILEPLALPWRCDASGPTLLGDDSDE